MQQTQTPATGALVGSYRYGKALKIFVLTLCVVLIGLAGFVLYLGTILPVQEAGPVSLTTQRGTTLNFSSQAMLIYFTSGLLVVLALALLGLYAWQSRLRKSSYELYEHGIAHTTGGQRSFVPFSEIEDLYLFSSGQTVMTGLVTNLAFRRNASQPFHRVIEPLKGFHDFLQRFRELYLAARQPQVLDTLQRGGAVTFNCIDNGQVWRKRVSGNFLAVHTYPIVLTQHSLQVQGKQVPIASLRSLDQSAWTEKLVIKDASGATVLSTLATGLMSADLFLDTLSLLVEHASQGQQQPA